MKLIKTVRSNGVQIWHDADRFKVCDGIKIYFYHREDGPAFVSPQGDNEWLFEAKTHRLDGPAIEWADGRKVYCIAGEILTREKHLEYVHSLNDESILIKLLYNIAE